MDLRATKDQYEREQEEAERLVRPAPKVKPPRHDRRREHVEPEEDDDRDEATAENDPDLSVNYKGRSAANVFLRYLIAKAKQPKKPGAMHGKSKPKPAGGKKLVPAWSTEEERVVNISEDTMKAEPGKYKPVKDQQEKPSPEEERFDKEPPAEQAKPEAGPPKDEAFYADASRQLREMAKGDPALEAMLVGTKPGGQLDGFARGNPNMPMAQLTKGKLPPGIETLGDFVQAARAKPSKKPPPAPPKPSEAPTEPPAAKPDEKSVEAPPEAKTDKPAEPKAIASKLDQLVQSGDLSPEDIASLRKDIAKAKTDLSAPKSMERLEETLGLSGISFDALEKALDENPELGKKKPAGGEKKPEEKPAEGEKPKLDPDDKKALDEWTKGKGHESPEFGAFLDKQKTVRKDKKTGKNLFRDEAKGKFVEFGALPDEQKLAWKQKFDGAAKSEKNLAGLKELSKAPEVSQLLRDLSNPNSEISQAIAAEGNPAHLDPSKTIPQLVGVDLPEGVETVADLVGAAREMYKPPPAPKRRKVSPEEQEAAHTEMAQVFPRSVVESLIASKTHPDDIRSMVDTFKAAQKEARRMPPSEVQGFLEKASKIYQTNPAKISPPEKGKNAAGEEVAWDQLKPDEQAEAMAQHRNKILALSMAARAHTTDLIARSTKSPPALAAKLADFTLNRPENESPLQRQQRAEAMAADMFKAGLESGDESEEMSEGEVVRALKMLGNDPAAQAVATGYFQARDYQSVRQKFLSPTSKDMISEHDSPDKIFKGMQKAVEYMRDRAKLYPEGTATQNTPEVFRARLLDRLRTLAPDKYEEIETRVNEARTEDHKKALHEWTKATGKHDLKVKTLTEKRDALVEQLDEVCEPPVQRGGPYRCPPFSERKVKKRNKKLEKLEQDLAALEAREPREPPEPPGYVPEYQRASKERGSVWDEVKLASRVAVRFAFSSCTHGNAMDRAASQNRQGVYWGVAPDATKPYPEWEQAHQRDLGKRDYDGLLTAARSWLKMPVLANSVEGIVRDTQVRAALDLAIRTHEDGRYSVGVHPTVYNYLLAKLAGESTADTLLTVQAADKSVYAATGERTAMKPSAHIRAYAAKIASTNPEIAFDLANLSAKIAQEEKDEKKDDKKDDDKEEGKPFPGAAKPFEKKEAQQDEDKKQSEDQGQKKEAQGQEEKKQSEDEKKEQQSKEAYMALRSACIRTAASNPAARAALTPVLQLIKQIG